MSGNHSKPAEKVILQFASRSELMRSQVLRDASDALVKRLTRRQSEVVRLISLGCTTSEAAAILGILPIAIDMHCSRAMNLLGIDEVAHLTRIAIKHQISPLGDQLTPAERRAIGRKSAQ